MYLYTRFCKQQSMTDFESKSYENDHTVDALKNVEDGWSTTGLRAALWDCSYSIRGNKKPPLFNTPDEKECIVGVLRKAFESGVCNVFKEFPCYIRHEDAEMGLNLANELWRNSEWLKTRANPEERKNELWKERKMFIEVLDEYQAKKFDYDFNIRLQPK